MRAVLMAVGLFWATALGAQVSDDTCRVVALQLDIDPSRCDAPPSKTPAISTPAERDYRIHFPEGSIILVDEYRRHLDMLVGLLRTELLHDTCLRLVGHSDATGKSAANQKLSVARADAVKAYIVEQYPEIAPRIETAGLGDTLPLAGYAARDPFNRRVEIFARRCL